MMNIVAPCGRHYIYETLGKTITFDCFFRGSGVFSKTITFDSESKVIVLLKILIYDLKNFTIAMMMHMSTSMCLSPS